MMVPFFIEDVDMKNVFLSNKISFGGKNKTCKFIIKLSQYVQCYQKRGLM